jgi:DNA (cytosine-5)-methyltransferase 1
LPVLAATPLTLTGVLERIDELLEARYRSADLGNFSGILDETVFILLARQTRDTVYRRVYRDLRAEYPSWESLLDADPVDVEALLRPSGFHRQRAAQLRQLLGHVDTVNSERQIGPYGKGAADLTLEFLHKMSDTGAEKFLCSLPGIGPKSARCVLAYSLDRPAFAVDTHVHRIVCRLGLVESNGRKVDHDPFQNIVPKPMRKRLHMNLVHHGRAVCRTSSERCGDCPLVSFCERGRQRVGDERPVVVDLFAGAGGMGLGFREAGCRIGLAVEPDRNAAQTYRFNHPGTPVIEARINARTRAADLRGLLPAGTEVHAVIAGPPCQGYSMSGRRRPEATSNTLYRHVARLSRQLHTEYLVLENVPGIRSVRGQSFLQPIQSSIETAGYSVQAHLLRASDFGVPQRRLRYFFLSRRRRRHRVSAPPAPLATHRPANCDAGPDRPPEQTQKVQEILGTVPALPAGTVAEPGYVDSDGTEYLNMSTMRHSDEVIEKIARIKPGKGPLSYRRLDGVEASTLIAGHRAMPVHPQLNRTISAREAALIQGFPLDYFFCGPRASHPLQIANAVPPPLARAVATGLIDPER